MPPCRAASWNARAITGSGMPAPVNAWTVARSRCGWSRSLPPPPDPSWPRVTSKAQLPQCGLERQRHLLLLPGADLGEQRQAEQLTRGAFGDREGAFGMPQAGGRLAEVDGHRVVNAGPDPGRLQLLEHPIPVRHPHHVEVPDVLIAVQGLRPDHFAQTG